jgi:parallel beta-helix repeat protein
MGLLSPSACPRFGLHLTRHPSSRLCTASEFFKNCRFATNLSRWKPSGQPLTPSAVCSEPTPLTTKSFRIRFSVKSRSKSFIYRIYASHPGGWGLLPIFSQAPATRPLAAATLRAVLILCLVVQPATFAATNALPYSHAQSARHGAVSCTWYVSPSGSDVASGSVNAPWRTAQHAFDSARSGETLCFRAGIYPMATRGRYNQTLNASGTPAGPITVTNYPGEVAILHGSTRVSGAYVIFLGTPANAPGLIFEGPTGPGSKLGLIEVMNTHDVTFDHVEIRNGDYHAGLYQFRGYNIQILGSYIHDNGVAGSNLDQGIYWDETTGGGNRIANCVIEHNAAQGIALYAGSSPSEPSQVTIEGNTIVDNGHYGIAIYGTKNIVVNNILANNGTKFNSQQLGIEEGTDHFIDSNILWSSIPSQQGMYNPAGQRVTNSIIKNPLFAGPTKHNYRLLPGSPAIEAGNPKYAEPFYADGGKRTSAPEIGAYAFHP